MHALWFNNAYFLIALLPEVRICIIPEGLALSFTDPKCIQCLNLEPMDPFISDELSIIQHTNIETDYPVYGVSEGDVTFYLVTSDNPNIYTKLEPSNLTALNNTNDKIIFCIHGWRKNRTDYWYAELKNAIFKTRPNHTIIQVDWDKLAHQFYYQASIDIYGVAEIVGNLILDLHKNYSVSLDQFVLIGHSLGGQMLGSIGGIIINATGKQLPRLIALDPAGPLFPERPESKRLTKTDGKVVEVIHTDTVAFGYKDPCGTIDFYPNCGRLQPGCLTLDIKETALCNHYRSCDYFVEAILNQTAFLSTRCDSCEQFLSNKCDGVQVYLGDLTTNENGTFYCKTNGKSPYSK